MVASDTVDRDGSERLFLCWARFSRVSVRRLFASIQPNDAMQLLHNMLRPNNPSLSFAVMSFAS